ncbi:MAG: hypothetical protein M5U26_29845 [Planctomycetota bacterium]|nr:hypothetical protein [Planctomycetota bacterium]
MKRISKGLNVAARKVEDTREALRWRLALAALVSLAVWFGRPAGAGESQQMAPEGATLFENNAPKGALEDRLKMAYEEFTRKNEMQQQLDGVKEILDKAKEAGVTGREGGNDKSGQWTNYQQPGAKQDDKAKAKQEMAEYREKLLQNLAYIKEMFAKGEASFQAEQYREAAAFYASVAMANVPNSEKMVEDSRKRFTEMEDFAKQHFNNAMDAHIQRDFTREVEELSIVTREFPFSNVHKEAYTRLVALKTNPKVAGLVEYAEAESTEAAGFTLKAYKQYQAIAGNSRYENTLAAVKAHRKLQDLNKNAASREQMNTELQTQADKEAPRLMNQADNFLMNNMPGQAREKLHAIIEKYPGTSYAEDAQKKLDGIPAANPK